MQIIPLFLVVCTCLGASWGARRSKLTPYAHRYTKAHMCKHAHKPRCTWNIAYCNTPNKHMVVGTLVCSQVCVYTPNTDPSMCSRSYSGAPVPMKMDKRTTMWVHASTCTCTGTCVFTASQFHTRMHTNSCPRVCALSNSQL